MKKLSGSRMVFMYVAVIIISVFSIISALSLYSSIEKVLVEEKGRKAMSVSIAVAKLIEQDYPSFHALMDVQEYADGSYDKAYYMHMQQVFLEIKEETGAKFIYCAKRTSENKIAYLFDGETPDSEMFSPLGSADDMDGIEKQVYQNKTSGFTPIINDSVWGELLTGASPIVDPITGEALAHVGVDVSIAQIHTALEDIKRLIILNSMAIIIITSLIIYRLLSMAAIFTENDYLTGLNNKRYEEQFLAQLIKKSTNSGKTFSLIMIDFDDFKIINDEHGHQFGDYVLKSVSEILKMYTRSIDCCARYGGDEFVVILPEANLEYASLVCQWFLSEVSALNLRSKEDATVSISISIGIAQWERDMTSEQVLVRADKALYHSKRTGKHKLTVYTEDLD